MKKIFFAFTLLLLSSTLWVEKASADKTFYIYSNEDWIKFRDEVDNAKSNYKVNARLEADITVKEVIGWNYHYNGTFNGNGHTLNLDITDAPIENNVAAFRWVDNVTIHDLHVTGKVKGEKHSAGLIGGCRSSSRIVIERVWVSAEVTSTSNQAGGFIGDCWSADVFMSDCRFDGKIITNNEGSSFVGCIIGWSLGGSWCLDRVYNCTSELPKAQRICFCGEYGGYFRATNESGFTITNTPWGDWGVNHYKMTDQNLVVEKMNERRSGSWHIVDGKAVPVMNQVSTTREWNIMNQALTGEWKKLSRDSSFGYILNSGNYYVPDDVTFTGGTGQSGLSIASGATVFLYIPKGVTLTARGGNASGRTGAGAGIEIPNGSALFLMGGGRVVATGGNAANGGDGKRGSNATTKTGPEEGWAGSGGDGGNGGGGAGAGIGTRGGDGGSGGIGPTGYWARDDHNGTSGNPGNNGSTAGDIGTLFIEQTYGLTVNATGGSAGSPGKAGSAGNSYLWYRGRSYYIYSMSGGGGGGGGGAGGFANNIGTGGAGGGGGAGGSCGAMGSKWTGYYSEYAEGGKGGQNGDGSYAPTGGQAGVNPDFLSSGKCTTNHNWSKSDCNESGGGGRGWSGAGGTAGSESNSRPVDREYLVRFNVLNKFGNTSSDKQAKAGYLSNKANQQVSFTIPTNLELGLTDINRYVTQWHTNRDGTGDLIRANDGFTSTGGTKDVYDTWKYYKDIFPEGSGTASSPFVIEHGELLSLADYVNACGNTHGLYFRQKSDILIENILKDANRNGQWIPIGYDESVAFEGDYDGGGHLIRKGEIASRANNQDLNAIGVFGMVLGSVHNLGAEDLKTSTNRSARCGAIAGMLCRWRNRFTNELVQAASMRNCYAAYNNINAYYAGGLVGEMQEYTSMSHCLETGSSLGNNAWGGLASIIDSNAKLDLCFTTGRYSGNGYSGATNSSVVNAQRMAGGELTWLLNDRSASTNVAWYQTLGSGDAANAYPVLDNNRSRVYSDGTKYSNSPLGIYAFPGKGTKEYPYQIATAYDLQQVALYCKDGNKSTGLYFTQTADFDLKDVKDYTPVGYDVNHAFEGYYDGGGHTIRNANITAKGSPYAGIFGVVKGTVNRLCVENSTFVGVKYGSDDGRAGGIAAQVTGNGVISNCFVKGCNVSINNVGVAGGVASEMFENAAIRNCLVYKTKGSATRFAYICSDTKRGNEISHCYTDGNSLIVQQDVKVTDSYANVKAEPLASGEICYQLNGGVKKADPAWFQNLTNKAETNDSTPVLSGEHAMVFERDGVYNNDYFDIGRLGKGTKESPYKIKTAEELQQIVQSMGIMKRSDFYIEQTADIDMTDKDMVPIGTCTESFSGHYDGGGHVISNLTMLNYEGQSMGLFNNISGTVERLGIVNSRFKAVDQITRVGAFAGKMTGNGVLRNCFVAGSTVDFNNTAGVVVGGLVGEQTDNSRIDSCYSYRNTVLGQNDGLRHYGHVVGYIGSKAAINYAFTSGAELSADRQDGADNIVNSATNVAADRFKTGEVCWLLSGSRNESKSVWGQTIRTDSIPMPNSTAHKPVYRHTFDQLVEYTNTDEVPYNTTLYLNPNYDGGGSEKALQIFRNDPRYYVPAVNLRQYAPVRKYYYLSSWNTQADGKGTSYAEDATVTPDSPLTLYAIWTPKVPADGTRQVYKMETEDATVKVYDEGGKVSPYDINYNGKLVLRAPSRHIIRLSGTVTTEALGSDGKPRDYLKVYDGDDLGDKLVNDRAKNDSVFCSTTDGDKEDIGMLMSSSNELTVEFVSDGENNFQGLDLTVTVLPKAIRDLGLGTKDNPFRVASAEDLQTVNDYMQRTNDSEIYVVQTADIDLAGAAFTPLASGIESFKGHYDGGGHVVRNLTLPSGTDAAAAGFFAYVSGTVERLGTDNVARIAGQLTGSGMLRYCYALSGALAGKQADASRIESCFVSPDANITPERFASGEICYQLNGSKSDSVVWRQTIGTDNLPTFDESHGVVYCHDIFGKNVYTNSATPKYEVRTKEEFSAIHDKEGDICLMNDLELGEWTLSRTFRIKGNFDGGGHTITYSGKGAFYGLFNMVAYGASVKHLRVKARINSWQNCGGIAYINNGVISDCHFKGDITLTKSISMASSANIFGGIALAPQEHSRIDHCSVTGTLRLQNKRSEMSVINPKRKETPNYWTSVSLTDTKLHAAQSDSALNVQADYPVYAKGILDVTRPRIIHGDQSYPLTSRQLPDFLNLTDGLPFSCSTEVTAPAVNYRRKGTNGAYEPWVLPFDYTITPNLLKAGVEFYRFEKDSVNNIQAKQITADTPYQVEANEPLLFRCDGDREGEYWLTHEVNGTTQPMTIRMPADGKAAQLESMKDIGRVMVTYGNIPADSTAKAMMYVWNNGEKDFKLSDGTQGIIPFRYYLQYVDKATGNLEEYEQTDWARKEQKYKDATQRPVTRAAATRRAALSEMAVQGWQPIFLIGNPLTVTAETLEDYDILLLSDLYDQEAASGTGEQQFDVALVYEPAEEGTEIDPGIPLLVKARSTDAEPLVTDEMVNELEKALTELTESENEEDFYALLDVLHYSYSTFKGEYDLWLMPLPESDRVLNEFGAFTFADKGYDQFFWRVPDSDATSMTPMSYCFTAYDVRTYENLPVSNDRIEIVVYDTSNTGTGIKEVEDVSAKRADAGSDAYNLQGQKVSDAYRGIVIKNGRKVMKR